MKVMMVQLAVEDSQNRQDRFLRVKRLLTEGLKKEKPDLILFPELWGCGFSNFGQYQQEAEPLEGETFAFMRTLAKEQRCYVHSGSFVEKQERPEGGWAYFNTSLLLDREGMRQAVYRKVHLFGYESMEQQILTPGRGAVTVESPFGRLGMATCYDLRFPEQFRKEPMADLWLITAAWPAARRAHWRLFNQVRAVENQCYVISCNVAGTQCGVAGGAHSMVVDPWGNIVLEGGDQEAVLFCDLDLERISDCRRRFPALQDRVELFSNT